MKRRKKNQMSLITARIRPARKRTGSGRSWKN
jgi:hypothetical protein